jgi:hypothetical protein
VYIIIAIHVVNPGTNFENIARVKYLSSGSPVVHEDSVESVAIMIKQQGAQFYSQGKNGAPLAKVFANHNGWRDFIESRWDSTLNNNLYAQDRY